MTLPVWFKALVAQGGGVLSAYLATRASTSLGVGLSLETTVALQATMAVLLSWVQGLPGWWLPVQALFVPALLMVLSLNIPPTLFLVGFVLLWLMFRHAAGERVPLYLSNRTTLQALLHFLPRQEAFRFIDLGCGFGGALAYLADARPDGYFQGVESSPLPWLLSWIRLLDKKNAEVQYHDIWSVCLAEYDVVYAFLSPSPMPALWEKARREMRPGSLLISNSFGIPGITPTQTTAVLDGRRTRLLIWHM